MCGARLSIEQSEFDAGTRAVLLAALEEVFGDVQSQTALSEQRVVAVRETIADALMSLAGAGQRSPEQLKRYAASRAANYLISARLGQV